MNFWKSVVVAALVAGRLAAQEPSKAEPAAIASLPPTQGSEELPFRFEIGGYGSSVDHGFGSWNGADAKLWFRNRYFTPALIVESQSRPTGTQQNYTFFSYLNWSKSFYTTQGFSYAPQRSDSSTYFPKRRYDMKGYWKLPPGRNLVLGAGYTRFDLGTGGHGQIFNLGALYYHRKLVVEGNVFVNRSQPGNLYSTSGMLSAQYGHEGSYWWGVTAGGGRELYKFVGQTPFDVQFSSYSVNAFYRKWFTRHTGMVISLDYLDKLSGYRRVGGGFHLFFEF